MTVSEASFQFDFLDLDEIDVDGLGKTSQHINSQDVERPETPAGTISQSFGDSFDQTITAAAADFPYEIDISYFNTADMNMFPQMENEAEPEISMDQLQNTNPLAWMDDQGELDLRVLNSDPSFDLGLPESEEEEHTSGESFGLLQTDSSFSSRNPSPPRMNKGLQNNTVEQPQIEEVGRDELQEIVQETRAQEQEEEQNEVRPLSVEEALVAFVKQGSYNNDQFAQAPTAQTMVEFFKNRIVEEEYYSTKTSNCKPAGYKGKFETLPDFKYSTTPCYSSWIKLPINIAQNRIEPERQAEINPCKLHPHHKGNPFTTGRIRYTRGPEILATLQHPGFSYYFSESRNKRCVYEPEIIRSQAHVDESGTELPINSTRFGLCPFCPHLEFLDMRTSAYGQHLAFHHGVCTDSYIMPEPLQYGNYQFKKKGTNRKTKAKYREVRAVVCPVCHDIVQVESSTSTSERQPFYGYLRHFKLEHRKASTAKRNQKSPSTRKFYKRMILH